MTMPTPDHGTFQPTSPGKARAAADVTTMTAGGAVLGAHMWFHEDMVRSLTGGRPEAKGWSGGIDDRGRKYIRLTVLGVQHTWVITGERRECPQIPGTWLEEGVWPD